ncbi:MAG: amidohydrolase family protein [Gammaproteobacteria bacterium]|nr:amidohydrolase family protein [Gammaproteobacteria bacterium]
MRLVRAGAAAFLTLVVSVPVAAEPETIIIHAGALVDVTSGNILDNRSIVISGEVIQAVEEGFLDGPRVVDLKGATVMPGWLDMHVHIVSEQSPDRLVERFKLEAADRAYRSVVYAERTLMAGFTTVRDLGTRDGVALSLRRAIGDGWVKGPRIYTAGKSLATTGGHADPSNGVKEEYRGDPGPLDGVVNGVDDAYKGVRARYKEGADLIKITATGGVLSEAKSGQNPQFTVAEIEAIVAAARDYGFKVAAHAHGAEGMKRAVLGGVDSIEHGTFMSDEVMRLMKRNGTWYVPTIIAGEFVAEKARAPGYFSEVVRPKAAAIGPKIQDTFGRAYRAGVKIAFGTDTGVSPHGDNWKEFGYMIEAGMPPMEAIQSATVSAAELLGEAKRLGSIEPGKLADIIAVPGDPTEDVNLFGKVHFVMKGGVVYKHE